MKRAIASACLLLLAACADPATTIDPNAPPNTMPQGQTTNPPAGYVQWCEDHPEDTGCKQV